jgi:hypothetical protein
MILQSGMHMSPEWLGAIYSFIWCEIKEKTILAIHAIVFQAEIFAVLSCARDCIERNYTRAQISICSYSQAVM